MNNNVPFKSLGQSKPKAASTDSAKAKPTTSVAADLPDYF